MKRALIFVLILLAVGSGCRSRPGKVKVTFWHAMGGEAQKTLKAMVERFEQENPDIDIVLVGMGNYDALAQKLLGAVAVKSPPTIAQMYENWTTQLFAAGELEFLEDYMNGPDGLTEDERSDIYPRLLENNRWEGKVLTLPFNKSVPVYYYNVNMLKAAGYDSFPNNWEEFRKMCRRLVRQNERGEVEVWATANGTDIWIFGSMLFQRGGRFLDQEDGKPEFNSPLGVEVLKFQVDLIYQDRVQTTMTGRNPMDDFLVGRVATLTGSSTWRAPVVDKESFPVGMAPVPLWGKKRAAIIYGTNIGLFKRAKPEEKRAAWRFIKWFIAPEQQVEWSLGTWYVPIHRRCLDDPRIKERLEKTPGLRAAYEQMEFGVFEPRGLKWLAGRKALVEELEAATLGIKTPEQALNDAARRYQAQ
ncbi:MAG: ABC transporter substrate-binding protein [candidate division WOR-3 bacterium]|nr:ABC transporter substrate-binding protein [candidate division WOR-3 bacterium]MCR4424209.1 ABC transporter substrate-binding protein [candidate division WOR-3 bacterium]MDH7519373.1 ABC transporter substrate-binding protein [bacterium]